MHLKADVKISTVFRQWWGQGWRSQNGLVSKMDLLLFVTSNGDFISKSLWNTLLHIILFQTQLQFLPVGNYYQNVLRKMNWYIKVKRVYSDIFRMMFSTLHWGLSCIHSPLHLRCVTVQWSYFRLCADYRIAVLQGSELEVQCVALSRGR